MGKEKASRDFPARLLRSQDFLSANHSAPGDEAEQEQQDARADEGDDDLDDEITYGDADEAGEPAAEERTQDPNDDVPDHAQAVAGHHLAGQESRESADEDKDDQAHSSLNLQTRLVAVI